MGDLELVLNMLAEATTTELSKVKEPETFEENRQVATKGGSVVRNARLDIESRSGKPVISPKKATDFTSLLGTVLEDGSGDLSGETE